MLKKLVNLPNIDNLTTLYNIISYLKIVLDFKLQTTIKNDVKYNKCW